MKGRAILVTSLACGLVLVLAVGFALAQSKGPQGDAGTLAGPVGTSFTYQGRLTDGGDPADGSYDFEFTLYDDPTVGDQVGSTVPKGDETVTDGLFTVQLDFGGDVFTGDDLWLEIGVRPGDSSGAHTTLGPRQRLTATPYAHYALKAPWSGLTGIPEGFKDGEDDDTTYMAGTGLNLVGAVLSADTTTLQRRVSGSCGSGNAIRVIDEDGTVTCESVGGGVDPHDHWGETWSGSGVGLTLNSTDEDALQLYGGDDGLQVESADDDGVFVKEPGEDGVLVTSPGRDGFSVTEPTSDGFYVRDAGDDGLGVVSASDNGVQVDHADNDGVHVGSAGGYGVYAEGTAGGLYGKTSGTGVYGESTGYEVAVYGLASYDGPFCREWPDLQAGGRFEANGPCGFGVYARGASWGLYTPDDVYVGGKIDVVGAVDPIIGERFEVDPQGHYEVGDLLVIDPDSPNLVLSSEPNDTKAIGVVGPSLDYARGELMVIVFGWHGAKPAEGDDENVRQVAQIKADAGYGSIKRGDLLTTSPTPGHAMKAQPVNVGGVEMHRPGTIVGKALESLDAGQGLIEIFVALQ